MVIFHSYVSLPEGRSNHCQRDKFDGQCSELYLDYLAKENPPLSNLEQPWATSNRLQRAVDDLRSWFCSVLGASRPWLIEASSVLQHAISMAQHFNFWSETIYLSLLDPHSCIPLSPRPFAPFSNGEKDLFPGMWKKKAWEVGWSSKKEGRPIRHEKVWQLSLASRDIYEL